MYYIIVSLKHGTPDEPCFWRANDAGYTNHLVAAGKYTEQQIKENPRYYNNGYDTIAVALTDQSLRAAGIRCSYEQAQLEHYFFTNKRRLMLDPNAKAAEEKPDNEVATPQSGDSEPVKEEKEDTGELVD